MQNPVSPTKPGTLASPQDRARAVQAVLDKDGPEMDRRRELTQEVVDALASPFFFCLGSTTWTVAVQLPPGTPLVSMLAVVS